MLKSNFFKDNEDIQFHFKHTMQMDQIFQWFSPEEKEAVSAKSAQEYIDSWRQVLDTLGEISGGMIAHNAKAVEEGGVTWVDGCLKKSPALEENLHVLGEFGMGAYGVSPQYGGLGAPFVYEMLGAELLNRACPSTMLNVSWYSNIAHIIELFGSETLKNLYIPKIATAEYSGSMALTEPDAGSDLGALRSYGVKQEDGSYKLFGTKRFITNGTSEISLVLAKTKKGAEGLQSLSLFLCPRMWEGKDNFIVSKLEHKIGLRGSATAELVFEHSTAWVLGQENDGFKYMLQLMNDSRIGVGFQGVGLMEATWQLAKEYAEQRKTWGKPIAKHELIAEKLLDMEVELKALRSISYKAAMYRSVLFACEKYVIRHPSLPEGKKTAMKQMISEASQALRHLTPLIKYWVGENAFLHARQAVQILGGYGYTTEYRAEWWVRESLIYALYEGTSQIQALMCVKDFLKSVVKHPRKFIEQTVSLKVHALRQSHPVLKKIVKIKECAHFSVMAVLLKILKSNVKTSMHAHSHMDLFSSIKMISRDLIKFENISPALLHAERICELECLVAFSESLWEDAQKAPERLKYAERFVAKAYLRAQCLRSHVESEENTVETL